MATWWTSLLPRARIGFSLGAIGILLLACAAGWWLLRPEQAILFSDLRPHDAAAVSAELEKLKIPYTVADNGTTLLVDRSQVHGVRLKLMGRELPLQGGVGLELFNTTDFGMTEFAQKVNFQRALQGELTRTILSLEEVRDVRVHLVLPEQGLFKHNATRAKAAITLGLRPGRELRAEQVTGIQRLVAAAVPNLSPQEVTIVDQQGLALSRPADAEGDAAAGSLRLELKRDTERYLSRKAGAVLDQAFGAGQAMASVDVTLNMDQVRVTTEDVIPAPDGKGGAAAGVLVRERESARDSVAADPRSVDARAPRGSSMQRDVEYQAGRRVEQIVSQPGAIRRIQVVAVVRESLGKEQEAQLQRLLAAAVGASPDRGDTVVVQVLQPRSAASQQAMPGALPSVPVAPAQAPESRWAIAAAVLLVLAFAVLAARRHRGRGQSVAPLTEEQRRATLQLVQTWVLESSTATSVPSGTRPENAE
jgi:flagellar M-ring protein FliF